MAGILLLMSLFVYGAGLPLLILIALPLVRWAVHGVLYFPATASELLHLAYLVVGMSLFTAVVMWLVGRWKGRW
jgi:hypothetical protein